MKTGPLWKVSISVSPEAEDAVIEFLSGFFERAPSAYFNARTDETVAEVYLENSSGCSARRLTALATGLRDIAACGLNLGPAKISVQRLRPQDWAESWKRHFQPLEIGHRLLIKPGWSRRPPRKNQAVVILDPGLSFGTGQHPTTRFCLEQLVAFQKRDTKQSFLDIGTGSGILAIAAVKLGYRPVDGFDLDADSVRIARTNARKNDVKPRFVRRDLTRAPLTSNRAYDLICANLISDLLLAERDHILDQLKGNGTLVLAGILKSQFKEVRRFYESAALKLVTTAAENEWQSGAFTRA